MSTTAILVDGAFYLKRAHYLWGDKHPDERASEMFNYCMRHLKEDHGKVEHDLYRIFYYDCPPLRKKVYHPLLNKTIDLEKSPTYKWMNAFHNELRSKRKTALRMGILSESECAYRLKDSALRKLCRHEINTTDLSEGDFEITLMQKGVDMKLGLDISSLAQKRLVNQIILISGDSDFVPAAKHARREGIDFILDPLWSHIKPELNEHIDGLSTRCAKPGPRATPDTK